MTYLKQNTEEIQRQENGLNSIKEGIQYITQKAYCEYSKIQRENTLASLENINKSEAKNDAKALITGLFPINLKDL